ncbi:hypothetical protein [Bauldia sp.]|uniref:hypothetical protein n=1 Tax=Bauldia sp. TaxID=2575872 RepID=UPI003BA85722
MPKQISDVFVSGSFAINFSKSGQKWKIDKDIDVGANGTVVFSGFTDSTLVNKGYVYSYIFQGAVFSKDDATLINKKPGLINGSSIGVLFSPELPTDVKGSAENHGKILGGNTGIYNDAMGDFTVENHGEVYGYSSGISSAAFNVGSTAGPVIKNYNFIKSDVYGVDVASGPSLRTKIVNQKDGVIEGGTFEDGGAAVYRASGDMTLINKGKIKGDVMSGAIGDKITVINTGKIKGDVYLGFGDDELDNRDGNITGYIYGTIGKDRLIAGDKKEKFVFDLAGPDRVKNFESGKDTFILDQNAFPALAPGPLEKSAFRRGTEAEDGDDRIIYDTDSGKLYHDDDGAGANPHVQIAKVDPGQKLKYSDFTVELFV